MVNSEVENEDRNAPWRQFTLHNSPFTIHPSQFTLSQAQAAHHHPQPAELAKELANRSRRAHDGRSVLPRTGTGFA